MIISRGGVEPLYADMLARGAAYLDVLDVFSTEEFGRLERERIGSKPRDKNQKRTGEFDRRVLAEAGHDSASPLLPAHMLELLERYPYPTLCY